MSNELIKNVSPNKTRMSNMAKKGYTTATDFADYLVKDKKLSFREAYKISSKIVNYAEKNKKHLDELSLIEIKKFHKDVNNNVMKVFDVKNSMNSKNSYGGTSEKNIRNMIKKYKRSLNENCNISFNINIYFRILRKNQIHDTKDH